MLQLQQHLSGVQEASWNRGTFGGLGLANVIKIWTHLLKFQENDITRGKKEWPEEEHFNKHLDSQLVPIRI